MKIKRKNRSINAIIFRYLCLFASICFVLPLFSQKISSSVKIDSVIEKSEILSSKINYIGSTPSNYIPLTTNNTLTASMGSVNMYDTYLSPLEYKGTSIQLMYEQMRRTTWFDYRFYKQQIFEVNFAKGDNPAQNVSEYWFLANYRIGGHYRLYNTDEFRFGIGGLWDVNAGVLYNERNGNNPATARVYSNLNLSLIASYKLKWFALRWQMDTPFLGILSSYRQSYYEMYIGNRENMIHFASLHNQRALRNYITIDIPIDKYTVRVGYMGSWYQTKVHDIKTHHYTNSFVIGFPIEGVKIPRGKARNDYWNSY